MPTTDTLVPMSPYLAELGDAIRVNLAPFTVSLHLEARARMPAPDNLTSLPTAEAETPGRDHRAVRGGVPRGSAAGVAQGAACGAPSRFAHHRAAVQRGDYLLASSDDESDEDVGRERRRRTERRVENRRART